MFGGVSLAGQRIGSFYTQNQQALADTLMRLSSGKKFQGPGDDVAGYVRVQAIDADLTTYHRMRERLGESKAIVDAGISGAEEVYDTLNRIQELANLVQQTSDADEQAAYENEYDGLVSTLASLKSGMVYRGESLYNNTVATIDVDPGSGTANLTVALADLDVSALPGNMATSGGATLANIDTAMGNVETYLAQAKATSSQLQSHMNVVDSTMQTHEAAKSAIQDIDEAEEMAKYTEQGIRNQAAVAMLSQANLARQAVLLLYR